jgi:hypothetical protein
MTLASGMILPIEMKTELQGPCSSFLTKSGVTFRMWVGFWDFVHYPLETALLIETDCYIAA